MATSDDVLSPEALHKAGDLEVFDENGEKVKFSSFYTEKQTLVIFIRHFLCGNCMVRQHNSLLHDLTFKEYVKALSTGIDPSELSSKGINVAIVGCGDHALIKSYVEDTGSKYPVYADPSQKLFDAFGLARTLALGKKPNYMSFGLVGGIMKGIMNALKAGTKAFKAGDVTQVGGE
jgi:AhpC/TSA antioxidant enzyme